MIWKKINNRGFTLAEMMIAVAIIVILSGVAFIGVNNYLRSMALLERDSIAKEIFVAAQNHLTMAKGQGYLGIQKSSFGTKDTIDRKEDGDLSNEPVFYLSGLTSPMAQLMLPLGSIDETVRAAGNFIICYQPESARVLDVFYGSTNSGRFDYDVKDNYSAITSVDYKDGSKRKDFRGKVFGWFGDEEAAKLIDSDKIDNPELVLKNDDILYARVKLSEAVSSGLTVQLIVEGLQSKASCVFDITEDFGTEKKAYFKLDDITVPNRRFSQIKSFYSSDSKKEIYSAEDFLPGEDIRVYVKVFKKGTISNIAVSAKKTTNSLFEAIGETEVIDDRTTPATYTTAYIGNCRHLENLHNTVSGLTVNRTTENGNFSFEKAVQTKDLFWNLTTDNRSFVQHTIVIRQQYFNETLGSISVYDNGGNATAATAANSYLPICPTFTLEYDGAKNMISDVLINYEGDAGLIGKGEYGGKVSNLKLVNFNVTSTNGNAGALAGSLLTTEAGGFHTTSIQNVIAYNNDSYAETENITANGSAGGLVGLMEANSSSSMGLVDACAAALYVESTGGDAGGLIGSVEGPLTIQNSYSGGHTSNAMYYSTSTTTGANGKITVTRTPTPEYNVIGSGDVGGLVGDAGGIVGGTKIINSYSTCSVYGSESTSNVGGLIGRAEIGTAETNPEISGCYATGYVTGAGEGEESDVESEDKTEKILTTIGAFAGKMELDSLKEDTVSYYFQIINERYSENGFQYLSPIGGIPTSNADGADLNALDGTVGLYNDFIGGSGNWKDAVPYDDSLKKYYHDSDNASAWKYNMKTVEQLSKENWDSNNEKKEYFVRTHYGDWPVPEIFVINTSSN